MDKLKLVSRVLRKNGFKVLSFAKKNENGPDVYVVKNKKPYAVEIKSCRVTKRNSVQVPPVEKNRKNDDFILIILPNKYVLFEKMSDHLKCCTQKGYRTMWS